MVAALALFKNNPSGGQQAGKDGEMLAFLDRLLARDYTSIPEDARDAVGAKLIELGKALQQSAQEDAEQVVESALHAANAAGHVAALTLPAEELNTAAQSMAAAVEEMSATVQDIHRSAEQIASEAEEMRATVETSVGTTRESVQRFSELSELVRHAVEGIHALGEASAEIGGIVETIETIASRTQLLSLNATIEAARAGESGRGFAVVANEVRTLAQQTAQATEDIRSRIEALTSRVRQITETMGQGEEIAQTGQETILNLGHHMEELGQKAGNVTGSITQITEIISQQTAAVDEISQGIGSVAEMSGRNLQAIRGLSEVAKALESAIGLQLGHLGSMDFPGKVIRLAIADHAIWMRRLYGVAHGEVKLREDELASHHSCRLGKWYYSPASEAFRSHPAFRELEGPHATVHQLGKEIVHLFNEGRKEEGLARIEKVREASEEVVRLLRQLVHSSRVDGF